jgi:hypothetical protein
MAPLYDPERVAVSHRAPALAATGAPLRCHPVSLSARCNTEQPGQNLLACLITLADELEDIGVLLDLLHKLDLLERDRQAGASPTLEAARQTYARLAPSIKQELIENLLLLVREHTEGRMPPGEERSLSDRLPVPV